MIWSIAWKNVWRNRLRSSVVISAFTIGLFGGLFTVAVMVGAVKQRIINAIGNEVSHIQIHHPAFLDNYDMNLTIADASGISDSIRSLPGVAGVSHRLKIFGMAGTAGNATGVMINGINLSEEKSVSGIYSLIPEGGGSFFDSSGHKTIFIGDKLAKTLKLVSYRLTKENLDLLRSKKKYTDLFPFLDTILEQSFRTEGDFDKKLEEIYGPAMAEKYSFVLKSTALKYNLRKKVVLSFQSADGTIAYDAFRVQGVYKTKNTAFDGMNVFVRYDDLIKITGIPEGTAHEIAIICDHADQVNTVTEIVKKINPGMLVESWEEIMPDISMYSHMMDYYLFIFMSVILLALGFGIVNTMLMAVLERIKELGMLMAIGMNKKRVFLMIMLETIFLALTGAIIGMVISFIAIRYFGLNGIDLSEFYQKGLEAFGFDAVLYPEISWIDFIEVTLLVVLTGILSSIYPARKALRLNPSEALRIDM